VKITIHDARRPRTFEIGARLDLVGDPMREIGPAPGGDGPWRARFSYTASGYQLELYSDDDRTEYVANGSAMPLEIERPRHVEAGDLVRAGAFTITIGYSVEALPPAPELEPRERQLLGLVAAEPLDDAPRRVLADYWLERGDPRGALIHAQCGGDTEAADALLAEHAVAWLEPLRLAGLDGAQFVRGFVPSLLVGKEPLATWPGLYRLSPVVYEVAMRRDSHVSHQYGLVTVPAIRRSAIEHGPVSLKYSMNGATDFIARERAILSLFRGPHLATLLDVAHGRDTDGLVFADDVRLYRLLGSGARFDEPAAIELGVQIADALVELHGLGIVHGDVGPDHVTIAGGMARLVDFAMARGKQPLPPLPPLPPGMLGPHIARYLAPEQVGAGRVERASDVWALAMLLAHIVLGRHPVQAHDDYQMLLAIRSADVTVPKTTSGLGAVLATALVADPAARPSAAVFREALAWVAADAGYPTGPKLLVR
jgi:uncharacterized protein (TIGR02996 family)